jgi:hypothetical protein
MTQTLAQRLQNLGVPQDMGQEVERQINAGTGNAFLLQCVGFVGEDAVNLANGITAGTINPVALSGGSVVPDVAVEIAKAINVAPRNTVAPVLSGTPTVGQALTVTNGTWVSKVGAPSYARVWYRDNDVILGQTVATYTLVSGDVGANISVRVTATNVHGSSVATSNSLGPVVEA